jgi:hypothetical protein
MLLARAACRPRLWLLVAGVQIGCALAGQAVFAEPPVAAKAADAKAADAKNGPDAKPAAGKPAAPKPSSAERLAMSQEQVAAKFKRFEEVLLRMAELTAAADPKRAALLRRAVAQSKEQAISSQMEKLVEELGQDKLTAALGDQQVVGQELGRLLDLLLSEQRSERLKDERQRLKRQIQQLKELINKQIELKAETARAPQLKELAKPQGHLAQEAGRLANEMQPAESQNSKSEKSPGDNSKKSAEKKPGDEKKPASGKGDKAAKPDGEKGSPQQGQPQAGKSQQGKQPGDANKPPKSNEKPTATPQEKQSSKDGEQSPGKSGEPKSGEPQSGKPSSGKPKSGKPQKGSPSDRPPSESPEGEESPSAEAQAEEQDAPGRKRVAAARQAMEEARKKLDEAKREGAQKDQEEALRQLEQAKAELEKILRQLRDEEVERVLAQLESRFRQMLAMEREVYEGTRRLDHVPPGNRGRGEEIEASRLSRRQAMIVLEAEKALAVLHEEGSAVALPEAVEEMREDMETVVGRLAQAKVDGQTQGIEEDIIAALEETIAALEKAQRDRQSKKPPPGGGGQPQDPPLVDRLAELKMIRALQMRVNTRTQRYAKLVNGDLGQGDTPELLDALRRLAEREQRIFRATRDIVVGKNQ